MLPRNRHLPATQLFLVALERTGGAVADYWQFMRDLRRYQSSYLRGGRTFVAELKQLQSRARHQQLLAALKRRQFIHIRRTAHKLVVELTTKGRQHILWYTLQRSPLLPPGSYTLVSFDIPEAARLARRELRWFLRQAGFTKLHQSVWISNQDVRKPLTQFVHQVRAGQWVTICTASHFSRPPRG